MRIKIKTVNEVRATKFLAGGKYRTYPKDKNMYQLKIKYNKRSPTACFAYDYRFKL